MIPLLSPKSFAEFSPEEYKAYIQSLYVEPEGPAPLADWTVRVNAKGNPVLTVRRKPKWLTSAEVSEIAQEIGWALQKTWLHITKKKIGIMIPNVRGKK